MNYQIRKKYLSGNIIAHSTTDCQIRQDALKIRSHERYNAQHDGVIVRNMAQNCEVLPK